jgi:hypothetical protein
MIMNAEFRFTRLPLGGYQVHSADATYLGDVAKGRDGWSSHFPGDEKPTPADRCTRQAAAERLAAVRTMREKTAERERPAVVPAGYELVDVDALERGDIVITPSRLTSSGKVAAWSPQPREVCKSEGHTVGFDYDPWNRDEHRFPHMIDWCRVVARRIETAETRAATEAKARMRHHSPALSDFDFMELLDFACRVDHEHSAEYAFANWTWTFEAPELNERAATLEGMLALIAEHSGVIAAFWRTRPGPLVTDLMSAHAHEIQHRKEFNALWAVRRHFQDCFYTLDSAEHAEHLRTATGPYAACTVYSRNEPGGAWIEFTGPIPSTPTQA